jgi:hypothetical protein
MKYINVKINEPPASMSAFIKLFSWIQLVYHTFDRIVINGYLDFFRTESNVVVFFRQVRKEPVITKPSCANAPPMSAGSKPMHDTPDPLQWVPRSRANPSATRKSSDQLWNESARPSALASITSS